MIDQPPPRPVHRIVAGNPDEVNQLLRKSMNNRLRPEEQQRLTALTWTGDETLERAHAFIARHPDLAHLVPLEHRPNGSDYEAKRAAAVVAGAVIPDPDLGDLDHWAAEYRATERMPEDLTGVQAVFHRQAFRAALAIPDMNEAIREWTRWLGDRDRLNAFNARRATARSAFGMQDAPGREPLPNFLAELADAVGGAPLNSLPIVQRS